MAKHDVDVLIVGGGGCGLSLSIFLADLGVTFLTVERNATTTDHPRAHILNQRTMEIFAQAGIADAIYEQGTPVRLPHAWIVHEGRRVSTHDLLRPGQWTLFATSERLREAAAEVAQALGIAIECV